jgi:hypothetical protein
MVLPGDESKFSKKENPLAGEDKSRASDTSI